MIRLLPLPVLTLTAPLQGAENLCHLIQGWPPSTPAEMLRWGPRASVAYPWLPSGTVTRLVDRPNVRLAQPR